ncbi:hypothetical protein KFZ58_11950 [Virgibacillus sp. NKC19-16]|uniref:hypothetical protein n=1 Tax=Virgibacillus salidurans TaxID=2831673 RepID=UPI001F3AD078|nr:hypothetical protein [Virgibacillus sp. NKC19-16]UJL45128.1 hypothetical protein KFZ58_11950 [Virgibacillus sp. NKC19-16]
MERKHFKNKYWILGTGIILFLFTLVNTNDLQIVEAEEDQQKEEHITHEEVISLTGEFMDILVQEADENYKVVNYDTKDELLNAFEQVTTRETAKIYVDYFYREEADGLYILPTETPPWFMEENEYDMVQLDNKQVKVVQENQSFFYDEYEIEIEFSFEKEWKITNISIR